MPLIATKSKRICKNTVFIVIQIKLVILHQEISLYIHENLSCAKKKTWEFVLDYITRMQENIHIIIVIS